MAISMASLHLSCNIFRKQLAKLNYLNQRFVVNVPPTATGKRRFRLPVESDPNKLVNFCCGLDYRKDLAPVKIKPDNEYPDWLWNMRLHPKKPSWELTRGTKEYYETLHAESVKRKNILKKAQGRTKKVVGKVMLRQMEWIRHIRFRALAHMEEDPGLEPGTLESDWFSSPLRQIKKRELYLPEQLDKVVYADKIPGNLYRKNYFKPEHSFASRYKSQKFYLS